MYFSIICMHSCFFNVYLYVSSYCIICGSSIDTWILFMLIHIYMYFPIIIVSAFLFSLFTCKYVLNYFCWFEATQWYKSDDMTSKYMYNVWICLVKNVIICLKYMMPFRLYEIQECVCVMLGEQSVITAFRHSSWLVGLWCLLVQLSLHHGIGSVLWCIHITAKKTGLSNVPLTLVKGNCVRISLEHNLHEIVGIFKRWFFLCVRADHVLLAQNK